MATASGVRGHLRLSAAMISRSSTDFPVPTQDSGQDECAYRALRGKSLDGRSKQRLILTRTASIKQTFPFLRKVQYMRLLCTQNDLPLFAATS